MEEKWRPNGLTQNVYGGVRLRMVQVGNEQRGHTPLSCENQI